MAFFTNLSVPLVLLAILFPTVALCYINPAATSVHQNTTKPSTYRSYIVLVEPPCSDASEEAHRQWHESFLPSESNESRLLHTYTEVFSGFAARLTDVELDTMTKKPGFVRAFPDRTMQLMTTHTPEFLGLRNGTGFWSQASYGKGVIIGLLDSGIYATHPSFNDHGVPPPPTRWKGSCKAARCNNKLIGAKSLIAGDDCTDDKEGHGTHTSSTAAGNFVTGASYHGMGMGTAAGIAPGAHIAMYKVCAANSCKQSTVLAGLEEAIKDGVDVLSLSIGTEFSVSLDHDPVAIGAFSAMSKGILVVCAAGNNGPHQHPGYLTNEAPWLLTVAAGSIDRSFSANIHLGNGKSIDGEALTQKASPSSSKMYPLLYSEERQYCFYSEGERSVAGKILVCKDHMSKLQHSKIRNIMSSGAVGVVLFNWRTCGYTTILEDTNSSTVQVSAADGEALLAYIASTTAMASLAYNGTQFGVRPAPVVAWFSSRGPSKYAPGILKPDILAPGLNILAAWPPSTGSGQGPFNVISGTSMATPHVGGVAALIKAIHPDWSPAAIKSAILTTSDMVNSTVGSILDEQHKKATVYDTGAGHVNPARAADPGLVYDLGVIDYAGYICWLLRDSGLATIVRNSSLTCAKLPKVQEVQLNYPTITVPLTSTWMHFTVNRTVTNVGPADSMFKAKVDVPGSLMVRVVPETLSFSKTGEKKSFSVWVSGHDLGLGKEKKALGKEQVHYVEGSLSWVSEKHVVRSPIVAVVTVGGGATAPSPSPSSSPSP